MAVGKIGWGFGIAMYVFFSCTTYYSFETSSVCRLDRRNALFDSALHSTEHLFWLCPEDVREEGGMVYGPHPGRFTEVI